MANYDYIDLIDRLEKKGVYSNKKEKKTIPKPSLVANGTRKSCWTNIEDTCKRMDRPVEHVKNFIAEELAVQCSIGGDEKLIIHGRFKSVQVQSVIVKYVKEYVKCPVCNSMNTIFEKQDRITFQKCLECFAVRNIK